MEGGKSTKRDLSARIAHGCVEQSEEPNSTDVPPAVVSCPVSTLTRALQPMLGTYMAPRSLIMIPRSVLSPFKTSIRKPEVPAGPCGPAVPAGPCAPAAPAVREVPEAQEGPAGLASQPPYRNFRRN